MNEYELESVSGHSLIEQPNDTQNDTTDIDQYLRRFIKSEDQMIPRQIENSSIEISSFKAFDTKKGIEVIWSVINLSTIGEKEIKSLRNCKDTFQELIDERTNEPCVSKFANVSLFIQSWEYSRELNMISYNYSTLKEFVETSVSVLRWRIVRKWCKQILTGLNSLHTNVPQITHQHLTCSHVYIDGGSGVTNIGDLWLAYINDEDCQSSTSRDRLSCMDPENQEKKNATAKENIYSFGMCVLEIIMREEPCIESLKKIQLLQAKEFISRCFLPEDSRPSAADLLEDGFLISKDDNDDVVTIESEIPKEETISEESTSRSHNFTTSYSHQSGAHHAPFEVSNSSSSLSIDNVNSRSTDDGFIPNVNSESPSIWSENESNHNISGIHQTCSSNEINPKLSTTSLTTKIMTMTSEESSHPVEVVEHSSDVDVIVPRTLQRTAIVNQDHKLQNCHSIPDASISSDRMLEMNEVIHPSNLCSALEKSEQQNGCGDGYILNGTNSKSAEEIIDSSLPQKLEPGHDVENIQSSGTQSFTSSPENKLSRRLHTGTASCSSPSLSVIVTTLGTSSGRKHSRSLSSGSFSFVADTSPKNISPLKSQEIDRSANFPSHEQEKSQQENDSGLEQQQTREDIQTLEPDQNVDKQTSENSNNDDEVLCLMCNVNSPMIDMKLKLSPKFHPNGETIIVEFQFNMNEDKIVAVASEMGKLLTMTVSVEELTRIFEKHIHNAVNLANNNPSKNPLKISDLGDSSIDSSASSRYSSFSASDGNSFSETSVEEAGGNNINSDEPHRENISITLNADDRDGNLMIVASNSLQNLNDTNIALVDMGSSHSIEMSISKTMNSDSVCISTSSLTSTDESTPNIMYTTSSESSKSIGSTSSTRSLTTNVLASMVDSIEMLNTPSPVENDKSDHFPKAVSDPNSLGTSQNISHNFGSNKILDSDSVTSNPPPLIDIVTEIDSSLSRVQDNTIVETREISEFPGYSMSHSQVCTPSNLEVDLSSLSSTKSTSSLLSEVSSLPLPTHSEPSLNETDSTIVISTSNSISTLAPASLSIATATLGSVSTNTAVSSFLDDVTTYISDNVRKKRSDSNSSNNSIPENKENNIVSNTIGDQVNSEALEMLTWSDDDLDALEREMKKELEIISNEERIARTTFESRILKHKEIQTDCEGSFTELEQEKDKKIADLRLKEELSKKRHKEKLQSLKDEYKEKLQNYWDERQKIENEQIQVQMQEKLQQQYLLQQLQHQQNNLQPMNMQQQPHNQQFFTPIYQHQQHQPSPLSQPIVTVSQPLGHAPSPMVSTSQLVASQSHSLGQGQPLTQINPSTLIAHPDTHQADPMITQQSVDMAAGASPRL